MTGAEPDSVPVAPAASLLAAPVFNNTPSASAEGRPWEHEMRDELPLDFELYDWNAIQASQAREKDARKAALQDALREALAQPLAVHTFESSTCVVLFGLIAYMSCGGVLSIAEHEQGVLKGLEGHFLEPVHSLAVMPTANGVREIAKYAIYLAAAKTLAAQSGGIVDLRSNWDSPWAPLFSPSAATALVELDAESAVGCVPMAGWGQIAKRFACMLALDRSLVRTSRWAMLGASSPLDAYERLQRSTLDAAGAHPGVQRRLVAHAISASIEDGESHQDIDEAMKWFRERLSRFGIRSRGWSLLTGTPLSYWRRTMRHGYDFETAALTLLIGQKLRAPGLPSRKFVDVIRDIDFDRELGPYLRFLPPRIWWLAYERFNAASSVAKSELGAVIPWAAKLGPSIPQSCKSSGWATLLQHAVEQIASDDLIAMMPAVPRPTSRFEEGEAKAFELTTERAIEAIGEVRNICLEPLWPEIETGAVRVFYASLKYEHAAIVLRPRGILTGWVVDEVKGSDSRRPTYRLISFAERLCRWCNQQADQGTRR